MARIAKPAGSADTDAPATGAPATGAPRKYASALMADRKQRILNEAQRLLAEEGVEGFTIRGLSRRADVAQRTLYNVFGSKEDIVASAIQQHFAEELQELPPGDITGDLDAMLARLRAVAAITIAQRPYATAMVGVFFSPGVDRRIYESLTRISRSGIEPWIAAAEKAKALVKMSAATRDRLVSMSVNSSYANVTDWAAGRIPDDEFVTRTQFNFLIIIRNFLRPKLRAQADAALEALLTKPAAPN